MNIYFKIIQIHFFRGSIFDLEDANRTISSVVKIDRQPKHNSLEALVSLQDAWDQIDSYKNMADYYKVITKVSYMVLLLAGVVISTVAIFANIMENKCNSTGLGTSSTSRYVILAVSLVVTAITAFVNFMVMLR